MGRITKKLSPEDRKKKQEVAALKKESDAAQGIVEKPKPAVAAKPAAAAAKANKEPNFFQKAAQFIRETKLEFKRVTWPSRQQTLATTAVVIILVIIVSIFLGLVDTGLSTVVRAVLSS